MELKGGGVRYAADRSRRRDPLLHAGSRRLHDRSRPVNWHARRKTRKEAARRLAWLGRDAIPPCPFRGARLARKRPATRTAYASRPMTPPGDAHPERRGRDSNPRESLRPLLA